MLYNILIFGVILFAGNGPVAQLAERCICTAKVTGSNPVGSTKHWIIRINISGFEWRRHDGAEPGSNAKLADFDA